jgi:hypothetical protein
VTLVRQELQAAGLRPPRDDLARLARYLEHRAKETTGRCEGCGKELTRRQRRWCADCRVSGWRRASG